MLVGWEACGALWNGVMTERLGIEGDELLGDMLVMLGVEEFPYEQTLALLDLVDISKTSPTHRFEIFNECLDMDPSPWTLIAVACLREVERISTAIEKAGEAGGRGKKITSAKAMLAFGPPSQQSKTLRKPFVAKPLVMAKQKPTFFDTLFAGLSETKEDVEDAEEAEVGREDGGHLPILLRRRGGAGGANGEGLRGNVYGESKQQQQQQQQHAQIFLNPTNTTANTTVSPSSAANLQAEAAALRDWVHRAIKTALVRLEQLGGALRGGSAGASISAATIEVEDGKGGERGIGAAVGMDVVLERVHFAIWAVQAISRLIVAATTEERYGMIQKDIPIVLNALLRCLLHVEVSAPKKRHANVAASATVATPRDAQVAEHLALLDVLQTSVYQITNFLDGHLNRFQFDKAYTTKLRRFVELKE